MTSLAFRPACVPLEDRTTPAAFPVLATGAAAGLPPEVRVYDGWGTELTRFLAYDPAFTGGVNVALGDVTGDGIPDIVTAPKAGGAPNVRVFDGTTFALVNSYYAFDPSFTGGASLAVANVTADEPFSAGDDIIVGAGAGGGPHVAVFRGRTVELVTSFYAFDPSFTGGVSVAATSGLWTDPVTILGFPGPNPPPPPPPTWASGSIVVGAGAGGAPHVKQFDADTFAVQQSFYAYDPGFRGGVNVAIHLRTLTTFSEIPTTNPGDGSPIYTYSSAGDVIVTGAGNGGGPNVKVFAEYGSGSTPAGFGEAASFFAGAATETRGVQVELNGYQILTYTGQPIETSGPRSYSFSLSGQPNRPSTATVTEGELGIPFLAGVSFGSLSKHRQWILPSRPVVGLLPIYPTTDPIPNPQS